MAKRLLQTDDLLKLKFAGDPQVSPQRNKIAYVLTEMSNENDGYFSSIYLVNNEGENQQLTNHYCNRRLIKDTAPRWSPDGKNLAFLSNRSESNQLWVISVSQGGEARPMTNVNGNVTEYSWSPDGKRIALTVEAQEDESPDDVKVITRLRYKEDGVHSFLEKRKHIYMMDTETQEVHKITKGDYDFYKPRFSPDGTQLLYLGSKDENQELAYIPSIWQYDLTTAQASLFYTAKGPVRALSYSPDGKFVAFIGHDNGDHYSFSMYVWIISTETKEAANVTKELDRTVGNVASVDAKYETAEQHIIWDTSSSKIYFTAMDKGSTHLYKTNLEGKVSEPLSKPKHTITSFDMIDDERAVMIEAHGHSTGDLVMQHVSNTNESKKLTKWNDALFETIKLSSPENIQFTSEDNVDIEGWLLRPTKTEKGKKSPLILYIHGGPHSAYGYGFHHEWQLLAAHGYAVLYFNPRGSQGYGQEFADKVLGDWGGKDYKDLMNGLQFALDKFDFIDQDNLFVTGASYGGYMTNTITTRTSKFKAAITQNSISNIYSMFGTSDIGFYFCSWQLGDIDLWEDEEKVMKFSPIRYAKNVKTPMLVLHNEKDHRCPIEQGEQWYVALRRLGVPAKFIRFPDEAHSLSSKGKPSHRLKRLNHMIDWFASYRH